MQSASRVRCHIGYGELAMSLPHSFLSNIVPVLIDILRDVPRIDFDESLSWEGTNACI
jgi:phosphatidylinositol 4-kinase